MMENFGWDMDTEPSGRVRHCPLATCTPAWHLHGGCSGRVYDITCSRFIWSSIQQMPSMHMAMATPSLPAAPQLSAADASAVMGQAPLGDAAPPSRSVSTNPQKMATDESFCLLVCLRLRKITVGESFCSVHAAAVIPTDSLQSK